jgi:hypothetical protein
MTLIETNEIELITIVKIFFVQTIHRCNFALFLCQEKLRPFLLGISQYLAESNERLLQEALGKENKDSTASI